MERWTGHVLTYDKGQGIRYLSKAPIRLKELRNGELIGDAIWNVRIPAPGVMIINERYSKGNTSGPAPYQWLGGHAIDPEALPSRYQYLLEPPYVKPEDSPE